VLVAGAVAVEAVLLIGSPQALVNTDYPAFIAAGRLLATVPVAIVLHALLAFPSGRLTTRPARTLTALGYLVTTVVLAPQYLFTPLPAPYDPLFVADRPDVLAVLNPPSRSWSARSCWPPPWSWCTGSPPGRRAPVSSSSAPDSRAAKRGHAYDLSRRADHQTAATRFAAAGLAGAQTGITSSPSASPSGGPPGASGRPARRADLTRWLAARPTLPYTDEFARTWGEIFAHAVRRGRQLDQRVGCVVTMLVASER